MINDRKDIRDQLLFLSNVTIDRFRNTLVFPNENNELVRYELIRLGIDIDINGNQNQEIDLDILPFNTFYNEEDFIENVNRKSWNKSIFIYSENIFYSIKDDKTYYKNLLNPNFFLVSNNYHIFKFFEFLKTQEHQANSAFYFVDYLNWDTYHLVLTSLKKDGKIEILLPQKGISIREDVKLAQSVSDFINAFNESNKHYPKFIKIELIAALSKVEKTNRLETLVLKLSEIIYAASQNFEIYIHDLSLENLKKDFIEHKNKYFTQLRDILSKLTNQIIGLPLAISASVFSTYKVNDSISTLLIIIAIFFIYSFYTVFLLKLQKEDIQDIKYGFQSDFNKLQESTFFIKFPLELNDFKKVKRNLDSRICSLIIAIDLYFFFFSISTIFFSLYIQKQLKFSDYKMFLVSAVLAVSFLSIYILNQTLQKEK